jgi:hypothetical protein
LKQKDTEIREERKRKTEKVKSESERGIQKKWKAKVREEDRERGIKRETDRKADRERGTKRETGRQRKYKKEASHWDKNRMEKERESLKASGGIESKKKFWPCQTIVRSFKNQLDGKSES